jgi:adenylylsulfate kinase
MATPATLPNNRTKYPILWFMGLSAAGKSTLSTNLELRLAALGWPVTRLDADDLRQGLNQGLGFSESDREENIRRASHVSRLLAGHTTVLAAFITPYARMREIFRDILPHAILIYVKCPVEECVRRDPKGLYQRALSGSLGTFTGISDTFEEPTDADLVIDSSETSIDDALDLIIRFGHERGLWNLPLETEIHLRVSQSVSTQLQEAAQAEGLESPGDYLLALAQEDRKDTPGYGHGRR